MGFELGPRRGLYIDISGETKEKQPADEAIAHLEQFDLMYRSLCAMLYNYVPMSGHPGGSISYGRFVSGIFFNHLDYDVANPDRVRSGGENRGAHPGRVDVDSRKFGNPERRIGQDPLRKGHYLGSGSADQVLEEAGLDGESQFKAILRYCERTTK